MLHNILLMLFGSGLSLLANLALSSHLSIEQFGTTTGLFSLASFLAVVFCQGQPGIILAQSPLVQRSTLRESIFRILSAMLVIAITLYINNTLNPNKKSNLIIDLIPFIALTCVTQILVGVNQARSNISRVSLFQIIPALSRSIPAIAMLTLLLLENTKIEIAEYFKYTKYLSTTLLIAASIALAREYRTSIYIRNNNSRSHAINRPHYWITSVLSSSYSMLISPIVLYLWGEKEAGIFGIYLLFWGVTNIIIGTTYNNWLLPKYAANRSNKENLEKLVKTSLKVSIAASAAILLFSIILFFICIHTVWPDEYKNYYLFFGLCLLSLVIRPFSTRLGLPFNFPDKIKKKSQAQIISLSFLIGGSTILSASGSYSLLGVAIVISEIIILVTYARYSKSS